jgi:hypothetical protein
MQTAAVTPISRKAKNRFANIMENNAQCIIEQHKEGKVFVASMNRKYFFWATLDNDPDWVVEL